MVDNETLWNEVAELQELVLAAGEPVTREEFFAEDYEEQAKFVAWLREQARDVRREERAA